MDDLRHPQNPEPKSTKTTRALLADIERRLNSLGLTIPERLFDESDSALINRMALMLPGVIDDFVERLNELRRP